MSSYIHYEIWLFLQALVMGAVLLLCYSTFDILKKLLPFHRLLAGILDLVFWFLAGIVVFVAIYKNNQGSIRIFLFLGLFGGAILAGWWLRPFYEKMGIRIMGFLAGLIKKWIKWLLFFLRRCKILMDNLQNRTKKVLKIDLQVKRGRKLGKVREKKQEKKNRSKSPRDVRHSSDRSGTSDYPDGGESGS